MEGFLCGLIKTKLMVKPVRAPPQRKTKKTQKTQKRETYGFLNRGAPTENQRKSFFVKSNRGAPTEKKGKREKKEKVRIPIVGALTENKKRGKKEKLRIFL